MGLVLRRKLNEAVVIDGNIKVRVASLRGGQVSLLIDAPHNVQIQREEIVGVPIAGSAEIARQMVEKGE